MPETQGELLTQAEAAERRHPEVEARPEPVARLPAVQSGPAALMEIIASLKQNPNFQMADLRELLAMKREWEAEENKKLFDAALARAQAKMPVVKRNMHVFFEAKNQGGTDTDYWHAGYGELVETIKGCLAAEGLSYRHRVEQGDEVRVTCILTHQAGHSEQVSMSGPPDATGGKNAIQAIKSTRTYLKRSTFEDVTGAVIDDADDDGQGYAAGDETITEEQVAEIQTQLDEFGADDASRAQFLQYLSRRAKRKIESLADIPSAAYPAALQGLSNKRKSLRAAQSPSAVADAVQRQDDLLD